MLLSLEFTIRPLAPVPVVLISPVKEVVLLSLEFTIRPLAPVPVVLISPVRVYSVLLVVMSQPSGFAPSTQAAAKLMLGKSKVAVKTRRDLLIIGFLLKLF